MTRGVSALTKAEIAGYITGRDGHDIPCPFTDGPLRDAWYEGFARGKARELTVKIEVLG